MVSIQLLYITSKIASITAFKLLLLLLIQGACNNSAIAIELNTSHISTPENETTYSIYDFIGAHNSVNLEEYQTRFIEVTDVLRKQAGIDIQSASGVGQFATPLIRGAEGQQVLVFNNGIPINKLNGSGADIGSTSLIGATRIDLYRGMVPMELSPTAIGGAINIVSEEPKANDGSAGFTTGTYGTKQSFLSQTYSLNSLKLKIDVDNIKADNDFIYKELQPTSSPSSPKNEPRYNNGSNNKQISSTLSYSFSENKKIRAYLHSEDSQRELTSQINSPNNTTSITTKRDSINLAYHFNLSPTSLLKTDYSFSDSTQIYDDRGNTVGLGQQYNQYNSLFNKVNATYKKNFDSINLVLNQQAQQEVLSNKFLNESTSNTDECDTKCDGEFTRQQFSSGLRAELQLKNDLFSNFQVVHLSNKDDAFSNDSQEKQQEFTSIISGISYRTSSGPILTVNISKQIRPPSTTELYGDRGTTTGNPELLAEKSQAIEVGIKHNTPKSNVSVYSFYRKVEDNISAEQDSIGIIKYSNLAQTSYLGIELTASIDITPNFRYACNFTNQKGLIDSTTNDLLSGNEIGDHRRLSMNNSIAYSPSWWSINLDYTLETGGYFDNANLNPRKDKHHWNVSLSSSWKNTSFSFTAKNLTNQRNRTYLHTPVPGRTFYLKATQTWSF